jgi:hypothetical protein
MFRRFHEELKKRGAVRWFIASKDHKDSSAIMRRLGFKQIETHYSRLV